MDKIKKIIIFDFFIGAVILLALNFGTNINRNWFNIEQLNLFSTTQEENYNFDLKVDPEEKKSLAGGTVEFDLSVENINMGSNGINNIVGYFSYDEALFDEVEIEAANENWKFEQNRDKNHAMYGRFIIYSMTDGILTNENIVKIKLKLKDNLTPQKTELNFTSLKSSNGDISVDEEDKRAVIEIYEQEPEKSEQQANPDVQVKPEHPIDSEIQTGQEIPKQTEPEISNNKTQILEVKTGDSVLFIILLLVIATIVLNIMIVLKDRDGKVENRSMKYTIISTFYIIVIGIIMLAVTSFAYSNQITELVKKLDAKESWLNSEEYLVTDGSVSRVPPNTNIEHVVNQFNKEIGIREKGTDNESTDGLITTGMSITDGKYSYDVSVLGDINEDGQSDHVDLTQIIRKNVNPDKWQLDSVQELSADMNIDGTIDKSDVDTSIKYILYGELKISAFNQVKEPKIEIVEGTYNNVIDAYEDTVKIKISSGDENAVRTKYKIEGVVWANEENEVSDEPSNTDILQKVTILKEYTEIQDGETIEISQNGVYKISAYSYGQQGNRSQIPYEIIINKNPNNKYRVKILEENVDGTYKERVEEREGRIGSTVEVQDESAEGFEINIDKSKLSGEILEDEELELSVTYDRKKYDLTLSTGEFISEVQQSGESGKTVTKKVKYGTNAQINAIVEEKAGYSTVFSGWTSSNTQLVQNKDTKEVTIVMPAGDIQLMATATRTANTVNYKVEYYYEDDNGVYPATTPYFVTRQQKTDQTVNIEEGDKTPHAQGHEQGYEFDENANNILSGEVTVNEEGEGTLVLKVYFKRSQYTVTLSAGDNVREVKGANSYKYGEKVTIEAVLDSEDGYIFGFDSWTGTNSDILENKENIITKFTMPANDVELTATATKTAKTDVRYVVEFYYEQNGQYPETANTSSARNDGVTGEIVSIKDEDKAAPEGYKLDETKNSEWSKTVLGNGTTKLKVYFKQQFKVIYLPGDFGTFEQQTTENIEYGTQTPSFKGEYTCREGYEFAGWNKEVADTVTENVEYTATWREVTYNIEYILNGGNYTEQDNANVIRTYTVTTNDYTIPKPVKVGYKFLGWTGSNSKTPEEVVTIAKGSTGNKTYTANWEAIEYTISYELNGGEEVTENPRSYTIETPGITLINPTKNGYEFLGWTGSNGDKNELTVTIDSGSTGNKEYVAHWRANSNISYTIEYYGEKLDGTGYDLLERNSLSNGTTDQTISIDTTRTFTGFELDEGKNSEWSGVVLADGSLVLKAYYNRKLFTLRLFTEKQNNVQKLILKQNKQEDEITEQELNGNDSITIEKTIKYQANVEIDAEVLEKPGYTTTFTSWVSNKTELLADQADKSSTFTMPAGDVQLTATAERTANTVDYRVEYYYEDINGQYPDTTEYSTTRQEQVAQTAQVENNDKIPHAEGYQVGYEFDESAHNILSGEVTVNQDGVGTLVLKVYFRRKTYKVTLTAGDNVNEVILSDSNHNKTVQGTYKYGETVAIEADLNQEVGYVFSFVEWTGEYSESLQNKEQIRTSFTMPAYDVSLTAIAQKVAREDVSYTIGYYYQKNGQYSDEANSSKVMNDGTTGKEVEVRDEDKVAPDGYALDDTKSEYLRGTVTGDGTLELKVYFKQQFKVEYLPGLHGTFTEQETMGLDYGAMTPEFVGEKNHEEGYEFAGWDKEISNTVTQDVQYTATWREIIYNINYVLKDGDFTEEDNANVLHTYTVTSNDYTIPKPVKEGYKFLGWTGSNGETPQEEVTIVNGSTGHKTYTANWQAIEYTISYELNGGEEVTENPRKYTIESPIITLINPTRAGYEFLGWTGSNGENSELTVTIVSGSTGNKQYIAHWRANSDVSYKVEYYGEKLEGDGYDLLESNSFSNGTTDETVTMDTTKTFDGFELDRDRSNEWSGVVSADGKLVLRAYYNRKSYTLKLYTEKENNVEKLILKQQSEGQKDQISEQELNSRENITIEKTVKYQANVEIDAEVSEKPGYTTTFDQWVSNHTELLANQSEKNSIFKMPAGDIQLTATAIRTANVVNYKVEYYYENESGQYPDTTTYNTTKEAKVGQTVEVDDTDKIPQAQGYEVGYEFDELAENKLSGEVTVNENGIGTLVLKVHFKRKTYKVTLTAGDNVNEVIISDDNRGKIAESTYKYGENVNIDATLNTEDGYAFSFSEWTGEQSGILQEKQSIKTSFRMPANNVNLTATATKTARSDVSYTIAYYYQENGQYPDSPKSTKTKTDGTTGQEVEVKEEDKVAPEGYALDETKSDSLRGIVAGDGTLELKVYYKQQFKVEYLPGLHGTFTEQETTGLDYGDTTPQFNGDKTHHDGYEFAGWDKQIADTVTKDEQYTATWNEIEYHINYDLQQGNFSDEDVEDVKYTYTVTTESFTLHTPERMGYRFTGWSGTDIDDKAETVEIQKGSTGDKSYTANWEAMTNISYNVEYYGEKLQGEGYDLLHKDTITNGTTDTMVTMDTSKVFEGFELDNTKNQEWSGKVLADGTLTLKAYYNRKSYTLTLYTQKENYVEKLILKENVTVEGSDTTEKVLGDQDSIRIDKAIKYDASVEIDAEVSQKAGYTTTFTQWVSDNKDMIEDKNSKNYTLKMPAGDVQLTAKATRTANMVGYTVEYYYMQDDGSYPTEPSSTDNTRQQLVDGTVSITEEDKIPRLEGHTEGYAYDEDARNVTEATVEVDEDGQCTTRLKVYFKKTKHTLTIIAGENIESISLGEQTAGAGQTLSKELSYGEQIQIDATPQNEPGYDITFEKWESNNKQEVQDSTTKNLTVTMPATDITMTATANKEAKDVTYYKEFYYQANGVYPETPKDRTESTAKVGQMVSITSADKVPILDDYTYDEDAVGKVESDTIRVNSEGEGITVLKIYYKQQFKVTYKPGEHGAFQEKVYSGIDYNGEIPQYEGSLDGSDGYIFDGWTAEKPEITRVTENLVFTANWSKMSVPTVTHTPKEWTNESVYITIEKPEGYEDYSVEYKINDDENWTTYVDTFEQQENCTVHARLFLGDNKGETVDYVIDNIDKEPPKFIKVTDELKSEDEAVINVKATDNLSGIVEYGIEMENYAGETIYTCDSVMQKDDISFSEIYENGTYQIYLKDQAGNVSTQEVIITGISQYNVATIVSAPDPYKELEGTSYISLQLALETSKEASKIDNVEIKIIHNIHNEKNTILPNSDYTINLNNYYIRNMEGGNTLTVQGKLQVVDRNKVGTGGVYSPFGVGIYIELNGELTLGEDDNKTPSVLSPVVEGLTYGIQKEINNNAEKIPDEETGNEYYPEGTFNFYDGIIIGKTASVNLQRVNHTPVLYDPTSKRNDETGKQETILAITSGVEALIGEKRYISIEEAIDDANNRIGNSNEQIEITVAQSLIKEQSIEVDETKNIKINLNGHTITTTASDYVFKNYGKLEIYDSVTDYNKANTYNYSINATEANDVNPMPMSGTSVSNLNSLNFNFEVNAENMDYTLTIDGSYLKRSCSVKLDNEEIFDLVNSSTSSQAIIELGRLDVGTHNISLTSTASYKPTVSKFTINNTYTPGTVTGTTAGTILNSVSSKAYDGIEYEEILANAQPNGEEKFVTRAEGGLISDNVGKRGTALSYVELDLTGKEGLYNVIVDASVSSGSKDYGFVTVTNDIETPAYNDTNGRKVYISGEIDYQDYQFSLVGGKKYYINLGFYKNTDKGTGKDCFIIKSMKYGKIDKAGDLTLKSGVYSNSLSNSSLATLENNSIAHVDGAIIKTMADYTSPIHNGTADSSAYLEMKNGDISSLRGHSIHNYGSALTIVSGGTITQSGSDYGAIMNSNRALLDIFGGALKGYYAVKNENVGKIAVNAGTLYGSYIALYNSSTSLYGVTLEGGEFTSSSNNNAICNGSKGNIEINNACIKGAGTGVLNSNSGNIQINNIEISDVDSEGIPTVSNGIQNSSTGHIVVNSGNVIAKNRAVYNTNKGNIDINGGQFSNNDKNYTTIENTGIENAKINIHGGTVNGIGGAVSNSGNSSTIVIGDEGSNVDTTNPIIKGSTYAIRNYYGNIEFYDGVLVGEKNGVIVGILNDIADECELVRTMNSDQLQEVTLGIPQQYVAQIATSGTDNIPDVTGIDQSYYKIEGETYKFVTLNSAIEACSANKEYTIELIDDSWIYRPITIEQDDNITIKFNDYTVYELCRLNITNNGILKLENELSSDKVDVSSTGGLIFENGQNATIDASNIKLVYESGKGDSSDYKKLINNHGTFNMKDCRYEALVEGTSTSSYAYPIYNDTDGIVNIDNENIDEPIKTEFSTFIISSSDDIRSETQDITTCAVTIKNTTIEGLQCAVAITNNGDGTINMQNSTVTTNSLQQFNLNNNSTGRILLKDCNVKNNVNNTKGGYIEIDDTVMQELNNSSSGSVLIKGDKSTLSKVNNSTKDGTVTIEGGKITQRSVPVVNKGKLYFTGGIVEKEFSENKYAIENTGSAEAKISGNAQIISEGGGITNSATLIIEGGKITAYNKNVGGVNNTNNLTIGIKDNIVNYIPIISGGKYGVNNTGTFNFYDGIIEGNETASISGAIPTETEEKTSTVIFTSKSSDGDEYIFKDGTESGHTVSSGREITVLETANVARLQSTNMEYNSIQSALEVAKETDTITIIHDVSINGNADSIIIDQGKNITLDMNGYNAVVAKDNMIINNGTLTITDNNQRDLNSLFISGANILLQNNATCNINKVNFGLSLGGDSKLYYDLINNTGSLTISNCEMYTTASYSNIISSSYGTVTISDSTLHADGTYSKCINNTEATTTINSGTYEANKNQSIAIYNTLGTVTVEDGTVAGEKYSTDNEGTGTINIKNGTYTGQVYNNSGGKLNIYNGTINGQVYNNGTDSTTNIYDGDITAKLYNNGGTVAITGGSISGKNDAVTNDNGGNMTIDGTNRTVESPITITGINNNSTTCIVNTGSKNVATLNIKGHVHLKATTDNSSDQIGIENNYNNIVNIGDIGSTSANINQDVKIDAADYGLYNYWNDGSGVINYYGGVINAKEAICGYIDDIVDGTNIITNIDENNHEMCQLGKYSDTVSVDGTKYSTLEEVMDGSGANKTIKLLRDITVMKEEKLNIGENNEITLDLNGHNIKLLYSDEAFINRGTFKVTDNSTDKDGKIYGYATVGIKNAGNFEISDGNIIIKQRKNEKMIHNVENGNVKISGGLVHNIAKSVSSTYYNIYSENSNQINVTGGTIATDGRYENLAGSIRQSSMYGIYCTSPGTTVDVTGGYFKCAGDSRRDIAVYIAKDANDSIVNMSGETNCDTAYGIYSESPVNVSIKDNINLNNGSYSIYISYDSDKDSTINIEGGIIKQINGSVRGGKCTINMTGGKITGNTGIDVSNNYDVNIFEGATIDVTGNAIYEANNVHIYGGTIIGKVARIKTLLEMTGGTITGTGHGIEVYGENSVVNIKDGKVTATNGPGILISSGTLNLGEDTSDYPDATTPAITGSTYGVQNKSGTFNFYDGVLTGGTNAISGVVSSTPESFSVIYSSDETVAILGINAKFEQIAKVNDMYYDDLPSAIDAAVLTNGTIMLCKNVPVQETVEIPSNKEITIDLAGFSLYGYIQSSEIITNNGNLTIIDSSVDNLTGNSICNYQGIAIVNNGKLTIGNDGDDVNIITPIIKGLDTAIDNSSGTVEFFDGEIGILNETGTIIKGNSELIVPHGYRYELQDNRYVLVSD